MARLAFHVLRGMFRLARHASRWTPQQRDREVGRWSRRLLELAGVQVSFQGDPPTHGLMVMNHVSWIDIFVLNAVCPSRFVAKSEISRWPLIGYLCTRSGTLYIERGRKRAAREANAAIASALAAGERVAVFPEGTTSYGEHVLHFHAALLQPAIDTAVEVHPVALRYAERDGAPTRRPSYVGDQSLMASLWALLSQRRTLARLEFGSPVAAAGWHRRALADALHAAVSRRLDASGCGSAPGTARDPQDAVR